MAVFTMGLLLQHASFERMGTKVQSKSYLPGFYSMRDFNEDSNGCSWPLYCGDKTLTSGQYYNSFFPRAIADVYPEYDKDRLKRTMLEHEAIFHNQVSELHRLYRIQRDLMDEVKKKELQKDQVPTGPSLSSSLLASQITTEVAHKCHIPNFPKANSVCGRPSISGVEDAHSRLSSVKGSSIQAGPFLSKNGVNLKDVEVLECRPTKVRRKMFDLQLPADTYIDIEEAEEFRNDTASEFSTYLPNGNGKIEPESDGKPFPNGVGKTSCHGDGSKSDACSKGKSCLADLNEPVEIEETNGSAYPHFLPHDRYHRGHELSAKPKPELLGFPKDISVNSHRQSDNRSITNLHVENNENARGFLSHVLEAGHSKGNSMSISQSFQAQKLPVPYQQVQVLFEKAHDPPTFSLTDRSRADFSRDRMLQSFEVSGRNHEISNNSHPESNMISKPSSSLNQKSLSVQTLPSLNSYGPYSKSSGISPHSNESFSEKRKESSNSKLNPAFGSEFSYRNGFHYGSSSGSKELGVQLFSTSYGSNVGKVVSEQFPTDNCSNGVDMKSAIDVNLNVVLSNNSSNMPVTQQGPQIDLRRKHEGHLPGLPWLRAKPACKNEAISARMDLNLNVGELIFFQSSSKKSTNKSETGNGFSQIFTQNVKSISSSNNADANRSEISECLHDKRILGVPIFEKHYVSENESSFTSPYVSGSQPSEGEAENKGRNVLLDINLPCDASLDASQDNVAENSAIEKEADMKISSFRHQIDLNSCAVEDEASFILNVPSTARKMTGGIDLEAPLIPEPKDVIHGEELSEKAHNLPLVSAERGDESLQDGPMKSAAEAIVAISSSGHCSHLDDVSCNSSETSTTDPLNWFAETVSSFGKDLESKLEAISRDKDRGRDESSLEEIDSFESMVLRLAETKEEDYMPEPLVPENFKVEETGSTSLLTTRTRKGQGRRGRQRRDFQRDILPGLASLSRHEVTQDLQTFGGLMRATGHSWNSGLTRRNCGRGRRRSITTSPPASAAATSHTPLMQQLNNTELGLDDGSLTGWGKTTRRPRRQRCPAGNLPSLALT
ncbi:uncharacterized protein LOC108464554 isoform X4 [Gossypium arboreum]|uniref:uncharacterized protein LOC108464554 isoform X4 n=1 Tax=Gossypium arboreum TaxID=29729 RepID=UPI0022F19A79|nr:uncharacterized protein LOC108464554 isoform X4 [Gossypium arboreum]